MQPVISVADPRISDYLSLRQSASRLKERGLLVVEGPEAIEQLFRSSLEVESVFFDECYYRQFAALLEGRKLPAEKILIASRPVMSEIVGYRLHRGVLAVAHRPPRVPVGGLNFPIVALNGLADAENVGSILRSAGAFGVQSFLVDELTSDPFLRRCIRVSMGAVLTSKVSYVGSLCSVLRDLDSSVEVVAVEQMPNAVPVSEVTFSKRTIFVFGKERGGIDRDVLDCCSSAITVPMNAINVNSLNVGCTAAVVLSHFYESQRAANATKTVSAHAGAIAPMVEK